MNETSQQEHRKRVYRWPWFVLVAVLLAIVLAVVWMNYEIQRTKRIRDATFPPQEDFTNNQPKTGSVP